MDLSLWPLNGHSHWFAGARLKHHSSPFQPDLWDEACETMALSTPGLLESWVALKDENRSLPKGQMCVFLQSSQPAIFLALNQQINDDARGQSALCEACLVACQHLGTTAMGEGDWLEYGG